MFSVPPEQPLTSTQRFTFISALVAYVIGGLTMIFVPNIWIMALRLDVEARGKGYLILIGSNLFVIGVCVITLARNKASQIPNAGPILGTIFNRLVIVNGIILRFYMQELINVSFALLFSILDSSLSLVTFAIWTREDKHSSLVQFFKDVWSALNPFAEKQPRFVMFQALGLVHLIVSIVAPSIMISKGIIPNIEGRQTEGLFRVAFAMYSLHALIHIFAAGSQNDSFPVASMLYRPTWNIPVLLVLGLTSQIPAGLVKFLIVCDIVFVGVTLLVFGRGNHVKAN